MNGVSGGYRLTPACSRAWQMPVSTPPKRAMSATARYAPVNRFSGVRSVDSPASVIFGNLHAAPWSRPRADDHLARHGVVRNPAVLVTDKGVLTGSIKPGRDSRDLSGQEHHVDGGSGDKEPMNHVPARGDERDGRAGRHSDLTGGEGPDLGDHPDLVPAGRDLKDSWLVERGCRSALRGAHAPL